MKKAYLVTAEVTTRVIIDTVGDGISVDEQAVRVAKDELLNKLKEDYQENITRIEEDLQCPYEEEHDIMGYQIRPVGVSHVANCYKGHFACDVLSEKVKEHYWKELTDAGQWAKWYVHPVLSGDIANPVMIDYAKVVL